MQFGGADLFVLLRSPSWGEQWRVKRGKRWLIPRFRVKKGLVLYQRQTLSEPVRQLSGIVFECLQEKMHVNAEKTGFGGCGRYSADKWYWQSVFSNAFLRLSPFVPFCNIIDNFSKIYFLQDSAEVGVLTRKSCTLRTFRTYYSTNNNFRCWYVRVVDSETPELLSAVSKVGVVFDDYLDGRQKAESSWEWHLTEKENSCMSWGPSAVGYHLPWGDR